MKKSKKSPGRSPNSKQNPRGGPRGPARGARAFAKPAHGAASQTPKPKGRAVVGVHATRELLKVRPSAVSELWLRDGYETHADLAQLAEVAKRYRVPTVVRSAATLDKIAAVHQGVAAFSTQDPELSFAHLAERERATLLVLDEVEDPHNLGAVLRTAWLLGADGVLTPEVRTAGLTATVAKVAQGAVEHVPIMRDTGLVESLKHLKEQGFWIFGLAAGGTKSLYDLEIPDKVIWVLGSESSGIRKPVERACDELVGIPQSDANASYNVSVAAALAMGETFRQRLAPRD